MDQQRSGGLWVRGGRGFAAWLDLRSSTAKKRTEHLAWGVPVAGSWPRPHPGFLPACPSAPATNASTSIVHRGNKMIKPCLQHNWPESLRVLGEGALPSHGGASEEANRRRGHIDRRGHVRIRGAFPGVTPPSKSVAARKLCSHLSDPSMSKRLLELPTHRRSSPRPRGMVLVRRLQIAGNTVWLMEGLDSVAARSADPRVRAPILRDP